MSEAFLPGDLASFANFGSVQGDNVVEFIDVMVQSLNYRFTSSKINGKRKSEAVSVSNAADKLLRYYVDARYKNENKDIAKIRAIVSSLEPSVRSNIELCQYVYHIMPREVTGLPGQPVDGTQVTAQSFDALHLGRSLIPLDVADQELADGVFDLSSVFPASLKSLVGDMRASRATWSGIMLLDRIFMEVDPYGTIKTLIENKLNDVTYSGPGNMSDFLGNKRKLFERLPTDNQVRFNNGLPLTQEISMQFAVEGRALTSTETIQYSGFTEAILARLLASPASKNNVKKTCEELLSKSRDQMDFNKCFHKLVIVDKLDHEYNAPPTELSIHANMSKRKRFQPKGKCYNCSEKGHLYFQCQKPLRADLQHRVDSYNSRHRNQKSSRREKKKVKSTDSE